MPEQNLILNVRNLTKRFPGVVALNNVQLKLHEGEFLSLIGENGAGKSTLMKILAGVQLQDEGTVEVSGQTVRMDNVKTSQAHGVALIHQELNLSENLSIAANIFLGREPTTAGFLNKRVFIRKRVASWAWSDWISILKRWLVTFRSGNNNWSKSPRH